jgi:hypothetical protein
VKKKKNLIQKKERPPLNSLNKRRISLRHLPLFYPGCLCDLICAASLKITLRQTIVQEWLRSLIWRGRDIFASHRVQEATNSTLGARDSADSVLVLFNDDGGPARDIATPRAKHPILRCSLRCRLPRSLAHCVLCQYSAHCTYSMGIRSRPELAAVKSEKWISSKTSN